MSKRTTHLLTDDHQVAQAVRARMGRPTPAFAPSGSERSPHFEPVISVQRPISDDLCIERIAFADRRDTAEPRGVARIETWFVFKSPELAPELDSASVMNSTAVLASAAYLAREIRLAGFVFADTTESFTGARVATPPGSNLFEQRPQAGGAEPSITPPALV